MKRCLVVLAVLLAVGCTRRVAAVSLTPDGPPLVTAEPEIPATPDAIAEVERALEAVTVRFDYDRDLLDIGAVDSLQRFAPVLRRNRAVKVVISGHCDERGTEEYNLLLGQKRADRARAFLATLGVADAQLDTISYGAEQPAVPEHSEEAWAANRRDDLAVRRPGHALAP